MILTPRQAMQKPWDVIVIGAGMGGGLAGRRLAEAGHTVLFVEKGPSGHRREEQYINVDLADPVARVAWAAWPKPASVTLDGQYSEMFMPVGSGVGGSSVFYAGILERPEAHDLDEHPECPHPTGGWAVSYAAFQPYYAEAEQLLEICGSPDPLSADPPPELIAPPATSQGEAALAADFEHRGLHPYRLHSALRYLDGCRGCPGNKCPLDCKRDGRSAGVEPALATRNAALLDNCEVMEIYEEGKGLITGLRVRHDGQDYMLRSGTYLLAAGALGSPRLLLASKGRHAAGCANSSGWVGRGLMFHLNEFFAIWLPRGVNFDGPVKAIAMRDFYLHRNQRLGLVQTLGVEANYGDIVQYFRAYVTQHRFLRRLGKLQELSRVPALIASKLLGNGKIFVGLLEDLPYAENRVYLNEADPEAFAIDYVIHPELKRRRKLLRKLIKRRLGWWRVLFLGLKPELNFGHSSGTLRFGKDPRTSVLDQDCKAHDLDNLYVVDASFMPTSMGVNPSLTIAANALRVADIVISRHPSKEAQRE